MDNLLHDAIIAFIVALLTFAANELRARTRHLRTLQRAGRAAKDIVKKAEVETVHKAVETVIATTTAEPLEKQE